jgi:hypothetical protein
MEPSLNSNVQNPQRNYAPREETTASPPFMPQFATSFVSPPPKSPPKSVLAQAHTNAHAPGMPPPQTVNPEAQTVKNQALPQLAEASSDAQPLVMQV